MVLLLGRRPQTCSVAVSILGVTADLFLILTVIVAADQRVPRTGPSSASSPAWWPTSRTTQTPRRAGPHLRPGRLFRRACSWPGSAPASPWSVALVAGAASSSWPSSCSGCSSSSSGRVPRLLTMIGAQMLPEAVLDGLITAPALRVPGAACDCCRRFIWMPARPRGADA